MQVWDHDYLAKDDAMGVAVIRLGEVLPAPNTKTPMTLELGAGKGVIELEITWVPSKAAPAPPSPAKHGARCAGSKQPVDIHHFDRVVGPRTHPVYHAGARRLHRQSLLRPKQHVELPFGVMEAGRGRITPRHARLPHLAQVHRDGDRLFLGLDDECAV